MSTDEQFDDPIAVKKAKGAYKACMDMELYDEFSVPETAVVIDQHGFPLVEERPNDKEIEYGWQDIADAISKYGIPMIFGIRVYPDIFNATQNLLYVNILFIVIVRIFNEIV